LLTGKVEVALRPWTRCRGNWLSATSTRNPHPVLGRRRDNCNFVWLGTTGDDQFTRPRSASITSCLGVAQTTELSLGVCFGLTTARMVESWSGQLFLSVSIECHSIDVLRPKRETASASREPKTNPRTVTEPNTEPAFFKCAPAAETSSRGNIIPPGK